MAITTATSQQTTNATTSVVTLPASVAAGDMLLALVCEDSGAASNTWNNSFNEILDTAVQSVIVAAAAYKIAAGGETSVTATHTTERSNQIGVRIPAAEWANDGTAPQISTIVTNAGSAAPDAGAVAPSWHATHGSIFITVAFWDDSAAVTVSAFPSGYTGNQVSNVTATSAGDIAMATRTVTTDVASEDAGAWTLSGSEQWGAVTIAVKGLALNSGNVTVTPGAFTTVAFTGAAPTVTASDKKTATPGAFTTVAWTGAAPSVNIGVNVVPGAFTAVAWTGAAPTVTVSDNKTVVPGAFTAVTFTGAAPSVLTPRLATPGAFTTVTWTGAAPTVTASNNQTVVPGAFGVVFTGAAPSVTASDHKLVTPGAFPTVTFTGAAPTVTVDTGGVNPPADPLAPLGPNWDTHSNPLSSGGGGSAAQRRRAAAEVEAHRTAILKDDEEVVAILLASLLGSIL